MKLKKKLWSNNIFSKILFYLAFKKFDPIIKSRSNILKEFSHLDSEQNINMVDVSDKEITKRTAVAKSQIKLTKDTLDLILQNKTAKGNVLETAKITGIMAAKKTWDIIPLCHPLKITKIAIEFNIKKELKIIEFLCTVKAMDRTGVEMEALTGASAAALAVYDMCKAYDKSMEIGSIMLLSKTGGKSGEFNRSLINEP